MVPERRNAILRGWQDDGKITAFQFTILRDALDEHQVECVS